VGGINYNHSVNFGAHSYNWTAMPTSDLVANNADVADLMYDCGVSVNMDYDPNGSGAWPSANVFRNNFRYRGTTEISSGTASDHTAAMAYSIRCGLPTVMCSSTHCVVACGYRDSVAPYFYLNGGHGHSDDGWYDLDQLGWDDKTIDRSYPYSSPNHYAYVDSGYNGSENGDLQTPYTTVAGGQAGVTTGGLLLLKGGHYVGPGNGAITLNKAMTLTNYLGPVTIGL
jgi:peptidase C10-like protein